jgi:hypothetical protein
VHVYHDANGRACGLTRSATGVAGLDDTRMRGRENEEWRVSKARQRRDERDV